MIRQISISNILNLFYAGASNTSGPIAAGHWSRYGATTGQPLNDDSEVLGVCPRGYYCPEGSETPTPCPSGTFG
jgi:hypothetical protein